MYGEIKNGETYRKHQELYFDFLKLYSKKRNSEEDKNLKDLSIKIQILQDELFKSDPNMKEQIERDLGPLPRI